MLLRGCESEGVMAVVGLGDRFVLDVWLHWKGVYALNRRTWDLKVMLGPGGATTEEIAALMGSDLVDCYRRAIGNDANFYGWSLLRTHPSNDGPWINAFNQPGINTSPSLPPQVAVLIKMSTGLLGRRNRGRTYIPFVPSGFVGSNGNLTPTAMVRYEDLRLLAVQGLTVNDGVTQYGFVPVVRTGSSAEGRPYINSSIEIVPATMRSRSRIYGDDLPPF